MEAFVEYEDLVEAINSQKNLNFTANCLIAKTISRTTGKQVSVGIFTWHELGTIQSGNLSPEAMDLVVAFDNLLVDELLFPIKIKF